jgi:small subunit ribosomal protein S27Ae
MQIFLHQLDGTQLILDISPQTTLDDLLSFPAQRLVYQGIVLRSLHSLTDNANVYVIGNLDGGKKKKKKKAYTTKKKNKHIHKRIKLACLNLYEVDGKHVIT